VVEQWVWIDPEHPQADRVLDFLIHLNPYDYGRWVWVPVMTREI
jgi:hypothetical protein